MLLGIARSSFYYQPRLTSANEVDLLNRLDQIFTAHPVYGSRRLQVALLREGISVGRRRIRRLMRKLGLCAVTPKRNTSKPHPEHKIYPYLLSGKTIDQPNQVWAADITSELLTPDIGCCKNVRFWRPGARQGAGAPAVAAVRLAGEAGKASPMRGGGRTANRMRRREPGKVVAVLSRLSQSAWAARVRCGELSGAKVIMSSLSETRMSPAVANSSCSRVRPS